MEQNNTNKNKKAVSDILKYIYGLTPAIVVINELIQYFISGQKSNFYGIPQHYFYDNSVYTLIFKLIYILCVLILLFTPFIIKKLSDGLKLNITKFESWYYAVLVACYSVVLFIWALIEISEKFTFGVLLSPIVIVIVIAITSVTIAFVMGRSAKKYLESYVKYISIKDDNMKDKPEKGYKFITLDFNGGKNLGEEKQPIRYQVAIGAKISDVIKYVKKHKYINDIKKDGKKLSYWSDGNNSNKQYVNKVITEDFDDKKTLYAQYNGEGKSDDDIARSRYIILSSVVGIVMISVLICIECSKADPANKKLYEVVPYGDKSKVIIGHYNGDAILMDYEPLPDNTKGIKLKVGKFYIDSVKGKKIEMENFETVKTEKPKEVKNTNH